MGNEQICLTKISKTYKKKKILDELEITFNIGECIIVTGNNGVGKTTLLKILSGLIFDDNHNTYFDDMNISALIEEPDFNANETGREIINYLLDSACKENVIKYINDFGLSDYIDFPIKKYSLGMKQKLALSIIFSKNSDIYLLDEPFNSLDSDSVDKLINIINNYKKSGKTIFVVTHNVARVYDYSDKIYKIENGKLYSKKESIKLDGTIYRIEFLSETEKNKAVGCLGGYKISEIDSRTIQIFIESFNIEQVLMILNKFLICGMEKIESKILKVNDNDKGN